MDAAQAALDQAGIQLAHDKDVLAIGQDEQQADEDRDTLDNANANLGYCAIRSPIDGVVVTRNVEEGQTVQASISAPTLYLLASTLISLRIKGQIDEPSVGLVP